MYVNISIYIHRYHFVTYVTHEFNETWDHTQIQWDMRQYTFVSPVAVPGIRIQINETWDNIHLYTYMRQYTDSMRHETIHRFVYIYLYIYIQTIHLYKYIYIYTYTSGNTVYIRQYICIHISVCIHTYIYIYIYLYIYIHQTIHLYKCMYIYTYTSEGGWATSNQSSKPSPLWVHSTHYKGTHELNESSETHDPTKSTLYIINESFK